MILHGVGAITLPDNTSASVTSAGGELGLLFAMDTASMSKEGHGSVFPGITETIFLQVPTRDGAVPEHTVLYESPCEAAEYGGLRAWATG